MFHKKTGSVKINFWLQRREALKIRHEFKSMAKETWNQVMFHEVTLVTQTEQVSHHLTELKKMFDLFFFLFSTGYGTFRRKLTNPNWWIPGQSSFNLPPDSPNRREVFQKSQRHRWRDRVSSIWEGMSAREWTKWKVLQRPIQDSTMSWCSPRISPRRRSSLEGTIFFLHGPVVTYTSVNYRWFQFSGSSREVGSGVPKELPEKRNGSSPCKSTWAQPFPRHHEAGGRRIEGYCPRTRGRRWGRTIKCPFKLPTRGEFTCSFINRGRIPQSSLHNASFIPARLDYKLSLIFRVYFISFYTLETKH